MFSSVDGRSVVVTGGTKGIARAGARARATVVVVGRDPDTARARGLLVARHGRLLVGRPVAVRFSRTASGGQPSSGPRRGRR